MLKREMRGSGSQKGFTLIEMSIVLVIIGLIIGGILKGQEIIDASRQKNLITQIDGLRSAINTFNDKYSALPGSFDQATKRIAVGAVNGLGLGIVGTNYASSATIIGASSVGAAVAAGHTAGGAADEVAVFWCQLAIADLIGNSSSNCAAIPTGFGNGSYLPATAYSGTGLSVAYGVSDTGDANATHDSLWLRVHRAPVTAPGPGLSALTLSAIDAKYDDGSPGTGSIRSAGIGGDCPIASVASVYTPLSATGSNVTCNMLADLVQ